MMTYRRVTCVLINHSAMDLIATDKDLNFKVLQGELSSPMPCPIAAGCQGSFVLRQAVDVTVGPSGWVCYEIAHELVFRVFFGDPALGKGEFRVGFNYLAKNFEGIAEVKFVGPTGPIDEAKVAETMDLTVEFHLDTRPAPTDATAPTGNGSSSRVVSAPPSCAVSIQIPPYIARWDQRVLNAQGKLGSFSITPRREKVLAAIFDTFPMLWELPTPGPPVGREPPVARENGGGTYKMKWPWRGPGTSCTSASVEVAGTLGIEERQWSRWAFKAIHSKAWIKWGNTEKKMPSVGDVYILFCDEVVRPKTRDYDDPHQRHVGFVVEVGADYLLTADGGQKAYGGREAAHLVKRPFTRRKPGPTNAAHLDIWKAAVGQNEKVLTKFVPRDPELKHWRDDQSLQRFFEEEALYVKGGAESRAAAGNRLAGWVDIDSIPDVEFAKMEEKPPDPPPWKKSYEKLGAMIESMRHL